MGTENIVIVAMLTILSIPKDVERIPLVICTDGSSTANAKA
jgi:hypothetical protein